MRLFARLILCLLVLNSCAGRTLLPPGTYNETRPRAILFVSRELRFYPDGRLLYFLHSDAVGSGRHASGTYELRDRQLSLHFTGPAPIPAPFGQEQPLKQDSILISVWSNYKDSISEPMAFASVRLLDATGNMIRLLACNEAGQVTLPLRQTPQPHRLEVAALGLQSWQHPWPATGTAYDVHLPPNHGHALPAVTTQTYRLLRRRANTLWLQKDGHTLMLVREPR